MVSFRLLQVNDQDLRLLVKEMDTNGDGNVTLKEFASFINLDDHEPLYQPLFDGRRRNVNILQACKSKHLKTSLEHTRNTSPCESVRLA